MKIFCLVHSLLPVYFRCVCFPCVRVCVCMDMEKSLCGNTVGEKIVVKWKHTH